ncbi:MAG TPA: hypothetical protein VFK89_07100 [Actinomycetota bacterium]|nr:hypothetical protein [Actinomycetota bacterium]
MTRRFTFLTAAVAGVLAIALPASAMPRDTTIRTIRDTNGDNMLEYAPGEDYTVVNGDPGFRPPRDGSILNFLQMSDFQILDEESPGRVEFLDTTQQQGPRPLGAAYRPQEALSTQLVEAMVRAARNTVSPLTSRQLQLAMLTGDNADSQQYNETRWFIDILDGHKKVDPNSGIPVPGCEATPGSLYDGVRGGGDLGYYDPDHSGEGTDGKGYSPVRTDNDSKGTGDVTVRDFPGLLEAAQQPFQAIGLDIPWYSAFGNHDALVQGNSPDAYEQSPLGPGNAPEPDAPENSNPAFQSIATGCYKPILPPPNAGQDPANFFGDLTSAVVVPPDPRRCYLAKDEADPTAPAPCDKAGWIEQHFLTTGTPVGHGFAPTATLDEASIEAGYGRPPVADANDDGYYSFSPTTGVRFVVLDTITDECGSLLCSEGTVDDPQFRWLESQLQTAVAMGQYVLVFSHHTERTTRWVSTDPTEFPIHYGQRVDQGDPMQPQNELSPSTLEDLFCAYPNVIAHIDGHEHVNAVRHHDCDQKLPNPLYPSAQKDYWEISTAAHIDWPQQTRMIELIDNHDGTMSLACTMLDHDGPANAGGPQKPDYAANGQAGEQVLKLAGIARELGYNDYQNDRGSAGTPADRNVIIVIDKPWPYAQ